MAGRVLITHSSTAAAAKLEEFLAEAGCDVFRANNIDAACHLLHQHPDLLVLDMALATAATELQLAQLAEQLELAETFCLRLCPPAADIAYLQQLTPFACGTICPPASSEQVLEQISTLLRIKQAEAERNLAQERLLLHQMEVEEGLKSAAQIQHALLPNLISDTPAFSFAWQFIPCETVGGDLFNVLPLSEETLMVYMLDVSGHGIPSAMVTVSVHQSLSERTGQLVKQPLDHPPYFRIAAPAEVLSALDREYPYERFEKFFTISYLLLEPKTGRLRYSTGGHPPPLLVRTDNRLERLSAGGSLVGLGGLVPYEEAELVLNPGDRLYLYSDGVTEHEALTGEMYGEMRMIEFLSRQRRNSLKETADSFILELQNFGDGAAPKDDVSLLCIQFNGAG